ncbi:MAG: serine/threonine-protein kinase [Minicystis sp.]
MIEPLWREGELFAGKYLVEEVLGRGGMGVVLGARHARLDEPVAIKVLLPALQDNAGVVDRFLREARAAAKIKSEHVVRVTDVDTLPSGVPFIVMERLEGVDLAALCKQRTTLEIEEAVRYVIDACDAVAEAHARGIVHRDLKPGNLFLARRIDGSAAIKVLDFGISKLPADGGEHVVTEAGQALGSPSYMSPEQMRSAHDVDARTDIWALGAVLFRLLTGRTPFRADSLPQLYTLVTHMTLQRPSELRPEIPAGLEAVIVRCLEKDPAQRFANADELADALLPFAGEGARPPVTRSRRRMLTPVDEGSGPVSSRSGSRRVSAASEIAREGDGHVKAASDRPTKFDSSDSAGLLASAVRARIESETPPGAARDRLKERRGVSRTVVAFAMLVLALGAAGAGIRVAHQSHTATTDSASAATAPAIAPDAAIAVTAAPPPEATSRAVASPAPTAPEPVVVPVASVAASTIAPPPVTAKRPLRPAEKKGPAHAASGADPFGGTRK